MVTVGLTLVDPLADVDVNVPGVIPILVAPVVTHLNVVPAPELMVVGLAANELIMGFVTAVTVTVRLAVARPKAFVT